MYCKYASVGNIKKEFECGGRQHQQPLIPWLVSVLSARKVSCWDTRKHRKVFQERGTKYELLFFVSKRKCEGKAASPYHSSHTHTRKKKHKDQFQSFFCLLTKLDSWWAWRFDFNVGRPTGELPISNRHRN